MSITVSMRDIAEAVGVSKAAVSRVINGRPAGIRISSQTRDRILSVVRQTGYQPDRFVREMAKQLKPTVGLILAPGGPDTSAVHLAAAEAVIAAAGYQLRLIILPVDPVASKDRVKALLQDGVAGLLCAPAAMAIAVQAVSGKCPVVALGQGAGETLLKALGVEVSEFRVESPASKVESRATPPQAPAPVSAPPATRVPVSEPIPLEGGNAPLSLVEGPLPPLSDPVSEPVAPPSPVLDTEPVIPVASTPDVVSEPPQAPVPVFTPPTTPEPVSEPIPLEGGNAPLSLVEGPLPPRPDPVSEPVAPPSPVLDTVPVIPVASTPDVVSEPPQDPVPVFTPPIIPAPVSEPVPLEGGNPSLPPPLNPVSEPVAPPSPVLDTEPVIPVVSTPDIVSEPPQAPIPVFTPPPVIPTPPPASAIHSTTQQPDNSTTAPPAPIITPEPEPVAAPQVVEPVPPSEQETTAPPAPLATETPEPEVNLDDARNIQ